MRYDPGGQGIQLLHRLLGMLHAALMTLEVFLGRGRVAWHQQKRRVCCVGLKSRGGIIICSFRTILLASYFTLQQESPRVYVPVPKLLPGRQGTAVQDGGAFTDALPRTSSDAA